MVTWYGCICCSLHKEHQLNRANGCWKPGHALLARQNLYVSLCPSTCLSCPHLLPCSRRGRFFLFSPRCQVWGLNRKTCCLGNVYFLATQFVELLENSHNFVQDLPQWTLIVRLGLPQGVRVTHGKRNALNLKRVKHAGLNLSKIPAPPRAASVVPRAATVPPPEVRELSSTPS